MKKRDLLLVYGTLQGVADLFAPVNDGKPLYRQAVGAWGDDIPELREYQLRELIPDIDERIAQAKAAAEVKKNLTDRAAA